MAVALQGASAGFARTNLDIYFTKSFMLNAQFLDEGRHSNSKVLEKILKLTDSFAVYLKYLLELACSFDLLN